MSPPRDGYPPHGRTSIQVDIVSGLLIARTRVVKVVKVPQMCRLNEILYCKRGVRLFLVRWIRLIFWEYLPAVDSVNDLVEEQERRPNIGEFDCLVV